MKERYDAFLDFSVPDFDYLYALASVVECPFADIHIHGIIYQDGEYKAKIRFFFSDTTCLCASLKGEDLNEIKHEIEDHVYSIPNGKVIKFFFIKNSTTKGKDLLKALCEHPDIQVVMRETDEE